ncbi:MAG: type IV pili methyl-accepting chemotaxis transducer N-terminal domain-containing protein [Burkholderiales bacterium]|nr:type IV pili methyl-accepting chemotaxis transducer N-terminal domain-containing protein [Burkholderiales bacterium]
MQRRSLITAAAASALALALPAANAQVADLSDAINKAGRQRMLSQRMGKAWLAMLLSVEKTSAQLVLDKSITLFDRQLLELKAFAPNAEVLATYAKLDGAWSDYKTLLVGKAPTREAAAALLQSSTKRAANLPPRCSYSKAHRKLPRASKMSWPWQTPSGCFLTMPCRTCKRARNAHARWPMCTWPAKTCSP